MATIVFPPRVPDILASRGALCSRSLFLSSFSCSSFISSDSSGLLSYGGLNERIKLSLHHCGSHEGHRLRPFVPWRGPSSLSCLIILICALLLHRFWYNALLVSLRSCYCLHFARSSFHDLTLLFQHFLAFLLPLHFGVVQRIP